jgi:hypothetical protein
MSIHRAKGFLRPVPWEKVGNQFIIIGISARPMTLFSSITARSEVPEAQVLLVLGGIGVMVDHEHLLA